MDLMKTCQTLIIDFYYYAVEIWLVHSHTVQHCIFLFLCTKSSPTVFSLIIKDSFFGELTDGLENPTNMDGLYCACHSKSIKEDEYIAAVPVNSRWSGAVVAVQPPQLVAKPGDGNVSPNWSGCCLRTTCCVKEKKNWLRTCVADVSPRRKNQLARDFG